ncbi:MAG: hypothetical protein H5T76_25145, partial [Streptomyces sp.]|nr:hypothetical protein [Streptomyces sp.]
MLAPLLPAGESLTEDIDHSDVRPGAHDYCNVRVDKKVALAMEVSRQTAYADLKYAMDDYRNLEEVTLGGRVKSAGVGENGAIAWLRCEPKEGQPRSDAVSGRPYQALVVEFNVGDPDLVPEDP